MMGTTVSAVTCRLTAKDGSTFTFEIREHHLFLNGEAAEISLANYPDSLLLTTKTGESAIDPELFWVAFAGTSPLSISDAGWLLARMLREWHRVHTLHTRFQELVATMNQASEPLWLPTRQLDETCRRALELYDGTPQITQWLAQILQCPEEEVAVFAQQHLREEEHQVIDLAPPAPLSNALSAEKRQHGRTFTEEEQRHMLDVYAQSHSVGSALTSLAQEYGCAEHVIRSLIYNHPQRPSKRESHRTVDKEGDQSTPNTPHEAS
jgi:hypothetical protein